MFDSVFIIYDGNKQGQTYYLDKMLGIEDKIISFLVKNSNNELFVLNIPNFIKDPQSNINLSSDSLSGWLYTNNYFITSEEMKSFLTEEQKVFKKIEPMIEYCHSAYIIPIELDKVSFAQEVNRYKEKEPIKIIKLIFNKIKNLFKKMRV
ncbi:hypothetical protein [Francisella sp. SYW-2]|uniref:hypothetical protein n=1 Tax=Francisella sp. SYW-2 TaxID=2610886 RepID=UPI00123D22CC|nr:hypothetical protein [Francisella sp. SYW-2]